MTLEAGTVVQSRYAIEELLGEGGMGEVWSARHLVTGKRVALKFLKATSPELHRRLVREARVAAAVRHPNLVEVHDVLELPDGTPLLVMDLLEGEPLSALLERRGALEPAEVGALLVPVMSAVAAAHAAGVVHRDLKPDNIFLLRGEDAAVKVLDFGIAKLTREIGSLRHTAAHLTQTGSVLGTPTYMAPEQVFGERDIDHRADIWSLGIIVYECLAGSCPTDGENVGQIFKTISQRSFAPLRTAKPSVPPELDALVDRMLASRPGERPTLAEVVSVLSAHAGLTAPHLPQPLLAVESEAPSVPHIAIQETVAATPAAAPRRLRRYALAGVFVLASAVGVGWAFASKPSAGEPPAAVAPVAAAAVEAPRQKSSAPTIAMASVAALEPPASDASQSSTAEPTANAARSAPPPRPQRSGPATQPAPPAPSPTSLPGGVHGGSPY